MLEPEVFFPALGAKINGLGWWFGYWGYDVGPFLCAYIVDCGCQILASLDLCITYRYCSLLHGMEYWKTWLFYLHFISAYIVSWSISLSLQQAHVPLEKFLEKAKQDGTYDHILPYIQNDPNAQIFGYSLEKVGWIFGLAGVVLFSIGFLVIKNSFLLWRLLSQFGKLNLSSTTARLHRRLTVLVAMQITYPFVAFSGPVIVFTVSVLMRWNWVYGSKVFHWIVESLICSLPLFNGVTTLYFVAPYKEALMK
ncbi:unnamed protein product, partial [Mesorhabditis belari]|uniref:Uncharacterized protein n=1 Tax=Mesorhabditis belari TaxID=2138241 RepID=A0AAF3EQW0_9BILA